MLEKLLKKLSLKQIFPYNDKQSQIDSLKIKLKIKENEYNKAAKLGEMAKEGFNNENTGKSFGHSQASALKYLKKHYKDLFEKIDFDRDEFESLNSTEKWQILKEHFNNQNEMDESCLEELVDFSKQSANYCKTLRTKLDNPLMPERVLTNAEAETKNVSTTPTADFVDNSPQDLPSVDDYID
jgi:hypothetical protein